MLTKIRVVQLVFMLIVLVGLFFWKTFEHKEDKITPKEGTNNTPMNLLRCDYQQACEFITKQGVFLLNIKNLPIKAEQWIDFELSTPHKNIQISKAQIVGKTMFMGRIPVTFSKSELQLFNSKALVGACMNEKMIWTLEVTVNKGDMQEQLAFDFMVER